LATGEWNGSVGRWSTTGQGQGALRSLFGPIAFHPVAWSPDRLTLAIGEGNRIRLRLAASGKETGLLPLRKARITALAWSPDGKTLAIADDEAGGLRLLDVPSRKPRSGVLKGPEGGIRCLAFSADSKLLASAAPDRTVAIWDAQSGRLLRSLSGNTGPILDLAFAPRGPLLATAGRDGTVRLWDATTGNEKAKGRHDGPVRRVAFGPGDGPGGPTLLATGGGDTTVRVWRVDGCQLLHTFGKNAAIRRVGWLDGQTVVSLDENRRLRHWDSRSGTLRKALVGVARLGQFSPDGSYLVSGTGSGYSFGLRFIGTSTGLIEGTILLGQGTRFLVFSPAGHYLASGQGMEEALVYVVETEAGQETLAPADFARRFGWKNDPGQARLAGGKP
jgi:WD40 repeat protein